MAAWHLTCRLFCNTRWRGDVPRQHTRLMAYYKTTKTLHKYGAFTLSGEMSSTRNSKSLQPVFGTDDAVHKLGRSHYYKFRAANLMFGFNSNITNRLLNFCEFNALRKNQLYVQTSTFLHLRTTRTRTSSHAHPIAPPMDQRCR